MPGFEPIQELFDAVTLQRGAEYFRQGRVVSLEAVGPLHWAAAVRGKARYPYSVELIFERGAHGTLTLLDVDCECVAYDACQHVVAAFMAVQDKSGPSQMLPTQALQPDSWLDALERTLEGSNEAPECAPETEKLAYQLTPYDEGQVLRTMELRLGLLGGRKKDRKFVLGRRRNIFIDARYPHDPHRPVEALLTVIYPPRYSYSAMHNEHGDARFLEHPQAAALIRAMAQTGRLYYGDDDATPLVWSAPREAALVWHIRSDLQQQLGLDLPEGVRAVTGEAAVYIDPAAHQVGPLRLEVPEAVQQAISNAPPLPLEQAEAFRARLSERLQRFIPVPRALQLREEKLPAQPLLTLAPHTTEDGRLQLRGRVAFRYGEALVDAKAPEKKTTYLEGDSVVTVPRQKRAEAKALRALGVKLDRQGEATFGSMNTVQEYAQEIERLTPLLDAGWLLQEGDGAPREVIDIATPVQLHVEDSVGASWFDLRMGVEVNGEQVDLAPLIAAALAHPEIGLQGADWAALGPRVYLPLDARRIIAMPTARLKGLMGAMRELLDSQGLGLGHAVELTHLLDTGDCTLSGQAYVFDLARRLRACETTVTQAPPASLQATLRPYQQHGLNWLTFLRTHELAGILADDMGLGKTLQTIAHLLCVHESGTADGPFLVVMPTSLLFNWRAELQRFAPTLEVHTHYGQDRQLEPLAAGAVLLTSYGVLLRDVELLAAVHFDTVVLDESHAIKNPRTKVHHAARALDAKHRLCLSGTPLQNNLEELWAQFAFLMPGLLDNHSQFGKTFRTPIERHRDVTVRAQLGARVRPFMLRRQKGDVARELPLKTEMIEKLELVGPQRDLYETVRNLMDHRVREALAERGIASSSIIVLDALLKLRQVCCDPRLVKTPQAKRVKGSAKLQRLLELVEELAAEGRRVLVFSQFTSMLELIGEALDKRKIAYVTLTGQTRDRAGVVESFQKGAAPVFLLSLKAGGVGLNLTAADTVIHYDPWWNPAAENQATDRAYRIGQDKPVFVYKLIVAGSVEQRILEMQQRKLQLTRGLVDDGAMAQQLTQGDLERLFAPLS